MIIKNGTHMGTKNHSSWKLLNGTGRRTTDYFVNFGITFRRSPKIHVALSGFDILRGHNHRLVVRVVRVTREGFILRYETWADTRVWSATTSWIAYGDQTFPLIRASAETLSDENAFDDIDDDDFHSIHHTETE